MFTKNKKVKILEIHRDLIDISSQAIEFKFQCEKIIQQFNLIERGGLLVK